MNKMQMMCPNCGMQIDSTHVHAMLEVAERKLAAERRKTMMTTIAGAGLSLALVGFLVRESAADADTLGAAPKTAVHLEQATPSAEGVFETRFASGGRIEHQEFQAEGAELFSFDHGVMGFHPDSTFAADFQPADHLAPQTEAFASHVAAPGARFTGAAVGGTHVHLFPTAHERALVNHIAIAIEHLDATALAGHFAPQRHADALVVVRRA